MQLRLGLITALLVATFAGTAPAAVVNDAIEKPGARAVGAQSLLSGARDIAVIKVKYTNTVAPTSTNMDLINTIDSVSSFYQEQSSDQTSFAFDAADIYSKTVAANFPSDCRSYFGLHDMASEAMVGFDASGYEHIMIVFRNPGTNCGYSGAADLPGNLIWIDEASTGVHEYTFAHEIGHNLGLEHSNATDCATCGSQEYGDPYDTMGLPKNDAGFYTGLRNFSGYERVRAGLEPVTEALASTNGDYGLSALTTYSGNRRITVPRGGTSAFSVELRAATGFDSLIDLRATNGILVRVVGTGEKSQLIDANPGGVRHDSPFMPGQTMTDPQTGIRITNLSTQLGQATVRVQIPPAVVAAPTGSITKPKFKNGKAKIPKNGKITYSFPGAGKLVFKLGGKSKTFKKPKATYTIPKKYRKAKAGTLKITASGGSLTKPYAKSFKLKKGVIKG